ncbi:MAG: histidinol-phosphatase HisJ family protein [Caldilineaceae bacterium]|nr:histidinol-phosphatase HisJ family protein [Caldilineaceae bacterium]
MQLHDYHMHTHFSCDSKATMVEMCKSAIAQEIPEIGFSEHFDLHPLEPCHNWFQVDPWWAELTRCRAEFAGQLIIRAGIEVGEPHLYQAEMHALVSRFPFDYLLGSLHWVGRHSMFDITYFKNHEAEVAYSTFFVELEKMTRQGGFDILSHFDVLTRTAQAVYGLYNVADYEDLVRPILRNCIDHGIALDLNTSALRKRANVLTPNREVLRWYVELGGERVTLGSDAHKPLDVGSHLDVALAIAKEAGLRYLTYFVERNAELRPMP